MSDPTTPYYGLTKPTVGADPDSWGGLLNANFDTIDAAMHNNSVALQVPGRNRVRNSEFMVSQRVSTGLTATGYSGPDRWVVYLVGSPGGTCTQSQQTMSYGGATNMFCARQTVTAVATTLSGSSFWGGFSQTIEGYDAYDMAQQPMSLQFIFSASIAGTYSFAIRDSATAYSYVQNFTVAAANTPTLYTFNIPAPPSGASFPNSNQPGMYLTIGAVNTGTFMCPTASLGAWQNANYFSGQGVVQWPLTSGATINLANVQLEKGPKCTTFEKKLYDQHARECYRYYVGQAQFVLSGSNGVAGQSVGGTMTFPAPMRAVGTPTLTGNTSANTSTPAASSLSSIGTTFISATVSSNGAYSINATFALSVDI